MRAEGGSLVPGVGGAGLEATLGLWRGAREDLGSAGVSAVVPAELVAGPEVEPHLIELQHEAAILELVDGARLPEPAEPDEGRGVLSNADLAGDKADNRGVDPPSRAGLLAHARARAGSTGSSTSSMRLMLASMHGWRLSASTTRRGARSSGL